MPDPGGGPAWNSAGQGGGGRQRVCPHAMPSRKRREIRAKIQTSGPSRKERERDEIPASIGEYPLRSVFCGAKSPLLFSFLPSLFTGKSRGENGEKSEK